jgi:hypothetical protein
VEGEVAWQAEQRQAAWDMQWRDAREGASMDGTDGHEDGSKAGQVSASQAVQW